MACASEANNSHHIRSISLPSRTHPSIVEIDEELNSFKNQEMSLNLTSSNICIGLSKLEGLYKCIDDLLNLPLTQQALSHHQHEKFVDELLDGSVKILDICGTTGDFMSQIKEHVVDLQSAIRRKKGDSSFGSSISIFTSFRRKTRKQARRMIADLKQVDNKIARASVLDLDHHLSAVIRVIREVSAMNISIFQSLLMFLSSPVSQSKTSKWSLVSKFIHKGTVICEENNELENVDSALGSYDSYDRESYEILRKRLEALHAGIELMENGIECTLRKLIRTRASLLNFVSSL